MWWWSVRIRTGERGSNSGTCKSCQELCIAARVDKCQSIHMRVNDALEHADTHIYIYIYIHVHTHTHTPLHHFASSRVQDTTIPSFNDGARNWGSQRLETIRFPPWRAMSCIQMANDASKPPRAELCIDAALDCYFSWLAMTLARVACASLIELAGLILCACIFQFGLGSTTPGWKVSTRFACSLPRQSERLSVLPLMRRVCTERLMTEFLNTFLNLKSRSFAWASYRWCRMAKARRGICFQRFSCTQHGPGCEFSWWVDDAGHVVM